MSGQWRQSAESVSDNLILASPYAPRQFMSELEEPLDWRLDWAYLQAVLVGQPTDVAVSRVNGFDLAYALVLESEDGYVVRIGMDADYRWYSGSKWFAAYMDSCRPARTV